MEAVTVVLPGLAIFLHAWISPFTKVEESFAVQAVHDFLYHFPDTEKFDHLDFPGVVPRSFVPPAFFAVLTKIVQIAAKSIGAELRKDSSLLAFRLILGAVVWHALERWISSQQNRSARIWLRILFATQFHFAFYASRPLYNTFALIFVLHALADAQRGNWTRTTRWATVAAFFLRVECLVFFGCLYLPPILERRLPLFGRRGHIVIGLTTLVAALALTVPLDSFLWRRPLWPEAEVAYFNVIENKSHEWGVSPWHWYFSSALPRAIGPAILALALGIVVDTTNRRLVLSTLAFVAVYSLLPHKELRFVIYALVPLNLAAAVGFDYLWTIRSTAVHRITRLFVLAILGVTLLLTTVATVASRANYPGAEATLFLQEKLLPNKSTEKLKIHVDEHAAQTGHTRFTEIVDGWIFDKTEKLTIDELTGDVRGFDCLVEGSYDWAQDRFKDRIEALTRSGAFVEAARIHAFARVNWQWILRPDTLLRELRRDPQRFPAFVPLEMRPASMLLCRKELVGSGTRNKT